jgi:hypothetical protein
VLLSSQLDTALTFKSVGQIQPTDTHVLPLLTEAPETNPSIEKLVELYSDYYSEEKRELVNKYITEHILDNETHVNAFISLLINNLRKKPTVSSSSSYYSKQSVAAGSLRSKAPPTENLKQADDQRSKQQAASLRSQAPVEKSLRSQVPPVEKEKSLRSQPMPQQELALEEEHRSIVIPKELIPEEHRSVKQAQESVRSKFSGGGNGSVRTPVLKSVPSSPVHNGILDTLDAPVTSEHAVSRVTALQPVKGSNKLQKRIHAIDQAIDAERLASDRLSQIKQNIEASYSEEGINDVSAMLEDEEFGVGVSSDFEHV